MVVVSSLVAACDAGGKSPGSSDPAVQRARRVVDEALHANGGYQGPAQGPRAEPPGRVVFVAADLTNGGIAGVGRGVEEAASAIGWPLQILDGQGTIDGRRTALEAALRLKPAGLILGGFDATEQSAELRIARARGIPYVGWHAAPRPGPVPSIGLFTNVTTDPDQVALLASYDAIAASNGTASAVVFTDSEYSIATRKSDLIVSTLEQCKRCAVLQVVDTPIAGAQIGDPAAVTALLERYGRRFTYLLAINGAYITGARVAFLNAGLQPDQPPFSIAAGDGDTSEFARIRAHDFQQATVAEPLNLQGWQLIDELNRARAGQPPSGYVAPPRLITQADVPPGAVFDPTTPYRANYTRIWHG